MILVFSTYNFVVHSRISRAENFRFYELLSDYTQALS